MLVKEFREFILRGNVVDLAIAFMLGAAFNAVVQALVKDIVTPLIAAVGGQPDFSALKFTVNGSQFNYGDFLNALISFVILAAVIFFLIVKPMNVFLARRKAKEEAPPASPTEDIALLTDIRDLLRRRAA
jgi:large conductance mechanosensitive channel